MLNFQSCYLPTENLSIDENLVGFKGWLAFLHYMHKMPQKWGMKAWVLADASNTVCLGIGGCTQGRMSAHLSRPSDWHTGLCGICSMTTGYGTRGTTSSWTTSTPVNDLFWDLQRDRFEVCGTLSSIRKAYLKSVRPRKGECHFSQDDSLHLLKWKDKNDVMMMSTFHHNSEANTPNLRWSGGNPETICGGGLQSEHGRCWQRHHCG